MTREPTQMELRLAQSDFERARASSLSLSTTLAGRKPDRDTRAHLRAISRMTWDKLEQGDRDEYLEIARRHIRLMRDPTGEDVWAMSSEVFNRISDGPGADLALQFWHEMIDGMSPETP